MFLDLNQLEPSRAPRAGRFLLMTGWALRGTSLLRKPKAWSAVPREVRTPQIWWSIWRDAAAGWISHGAGQLGASLAYYSIFAIGPLLIIAIAISSLVFDETEVRGRISGQISGLIGVGAADGIDRLLTGIGSPSQGVFASIFGVAILLVGALGVVVQLKSALNTVFEVPAPPSLGVWTFIRVYAVSLAVVLAAGFLLLVSLLISTILSSTGTLLAPYIFPAVLQGGNVIVSFFVSTAIFFSMFKWLPDIDLGWSSILPGAFLTAALFDIGRFLIGLYIGRQALESTYGAAGSLVAILIWVYYSSQIVLFGAEFIRAYAQASGSRRKDLGHR